MSRRTKYATLAASQIKQEEVNVPVLIQEFPNASDDEPQYAYAIVSNSVSDEEAEAAVASLHHRQHLESGISTQEVIIDENGRAVTIQEFVGDDGGAYVQVEEVEAVDEADGTHTILHIVPSDDGTEHVVHAESIDGDTICIDSEGGEAYEGPDGEIITADSIARSKNFYCTNCGNCYTAAGSLKLHMRACLRQREEVPADQRRCEICNKVFNSVSYLKEHMLRHTGQGPKRCQRCYRKFVDDEKYEAHMEQHKQQDKLDAEAETIAASHGGRKVVLKEFTCSFCSEKFTVVFEAGQVKRRYACDACREKYSNAENLKQHKQSAGDKREFPCERCGRKFVFEGFLQRHLPICDGSIKRRRDMK